MEINKKLHDEIKEYCKLNNLKMGEYVNKLLRQAFNIDKFGISPFMTRENIVVEEEYPTTEKKDVIIEDTSNKEEEKKSEENTSEIEETITLDNGIHLNKIKKNKRKLK